MSCYCLCLTLTGKVLSWRIDYLSILALKENQCFFYILIFIPRISDGGGITPMRHTRTHNPVSLHAAVWIYCLFQTHLELGEPTFYVRFLFWCQLHLIVLQRQLLNSYQQRAKVCACVWASPAHFHFLWSTVFLGWYGFWFGLRRVLVQEWS